MTDNPDKAGHVEGTRPAAEGVDPLVERINDALKLYSDKDWNYSRISLVTRSLDACTTAYGLGIEVLDLTTKAGLGQLKTLTDEVKWGERHSSELGLLELVSLRINKALLESTDHDFWDMKRPVIRVHKLEAVEAQAIQNTLWYQVVEVGGEDFDNR